MSIISSLITREFAIIKSDTRGTADRILPFVCPKGMLLGRDSGAILIAFCGILNFNGKDTYCHLKGEADILFDIYNRTDERVAIALGEHLRTVLAPQIIKNPPENYNYKKLTIHIIAKKDRANPFIYRIEIDFKDGAEIKVEGMFGVEKGYAIARDGGNEACSTFSKIIPDDSIYSTLDYDSCEAVLDIKMRKAIDADISCGYPIDTFSFKF